MALAGSSALVAPSALAQLAPNAAPGGSSVSAGQASVRTGGATTLITQSSQNAVINWQSYNVGSAHTVQYAQPNSKSFTLNRVISSAPSQIAGHITANGQIAIVNQSGVVFLHGATVDTGGLVVSASGISNQDFMAGRLIFSQAANPGAVVSNAGNITIRQAGLAALVAPQVINSGTITAQLGRVVLAGATTHTIDMYGDGLVALNITGQVTQVQLGGKNVTALVTNIGTILAPGGTVVLTAQAADGVVSKAISAGGTVAAPTVGAQTGRVLVQGIGGDVEVDGEVAATGAGAGTRGGQVEITGDHTVTVAPGALVDASGGAGGGAVAVGRRLAAGSGPTAVNTTIAAAARVRADAHAVGHGGHVTIAALGRVTLAGSVGARGGARAGNGGNVTIAARTLDASVGPDTGVSHGTAGTLQLDMTGNQEVRKYCKGAEGCVNYVVFTQLARSQTGFTVTDGSITFDDQTNGFIRPTSIRLSTIGSGDIIFGPGTLFSVGHLTADAAGNIQLLGSLRSINNAGSISLMAGAITEDQSPGVPLGAIRTGNLFILARNGDVELDNPLNQIVTLQSVSATSGIFTLGDGLALTIAGPVTAAGVDIVAAGSVTDTGDINGGVGGISITSGDAIALGGTLSAAFVALEALGGSITETVSGAGAGVLQTGTLAALAGGDLVLDNAANSVATIGTVGGLAGLSSGTDAGQQLIFDTAGNLLIGANVTGSDVVLHAAGSITEAAGSTVMARASAGAGGTLALLADTGSISLAGTTVAGLLVLDAGGGIDEASGAGSIIAGQLAGVAGGTVTLDGAANQIATIAPATLSALGLTLSGLHAGGALVLNTAGPLALQDAAVGGTSVSLSLGGPSGTLTQLSGALAATSGDVSISAAELVQSGGAVIEAGRNVTINGGALVQQGGTIVAGLATASGSVALTLDGGLSQAGSADTIATAGAGGIGITLTAGDLRQSGGSIVSTGGSVAITALHGGIYAGGMIGSGLAGGTVALSAATTLALAGGGTISVLNGTIALRADQFQLAGSIAAGSGIAAFDRYDTGVLALGSGSTGGTYYMDSFSGQAFGALTAGALVLGSTLAGTGVASGLYLFSLPAGAIQGVGALGLYSRGDIIEGNGVQFGATGLFGHAGGNIALLSSYNDFTDILALGASAANGLTADGALHLIDAGTLAIDARANLTGANGVYVSAAGLAADAGSLIASTTGPVALVTNAGGMRLGGTVQAGLVALAANGGVQDNGTIVSTGSILAGTFSASATGDLLLAGTNRIGTIAPVSVVDPLIFGTLSLNGLIAGGNISLRDQIALAETSTGSTGATISAGGTIWMLLAGGLAQDAASVIASTAPAAGAVALEATAGDLALGGTLAAGSAGQVVLVADQGGIAASGIVTAGTLAALAGAGDLELTGTANQIATVGGITVTDPQQQGSIAARGLAATGTLALRDAAALNLGGATVAAGQGLVLVLNDGLIQAAGGLVTTRHGAFVIDATGGDISADGTFQAAEVGSMMLLAGAGSIIDQGRVLAATLAAAATGDLQFTGTGNLIGTIAPLTAHGAGLPGTLALAGLQAGGSVVLRDAQALTLGTGGAPAAVTGAGVTLSVVNGAGAASGMLTQNAGVIAASGGNVVLTATQVAQQGGAILAAGDGMVHIAGGGLAQADGAVMAAGSFVVDGALAQSGATLTTTGDVTVGGGLSQTGGTLRAGGDVRVAGATSQAGASLAASGNVTVSGGLNQAGSRLSAGGRIAVTGAGGLTQLNATLQAGTGVLLDLGGGLRQDAASVIASTAGAVDIVAARGDIAFAGTLQGGAVGLNALAGNVAGSGIVLAGTLAANAAGSLDFSNGGNRISSIGRHSGGPGGGTLDGLTAAGSIVLADATSLAVNDAVVRGSAVTLTADGGLSQNGGLIDASGAVRLTTTGGTLSQAGGGTISGAAGVVLVAGAGLEQAAGSVIESLAPTAGPGGRATQNGSITVATGGNISLAGTLAAGQIVLGSGGPARHVTWNGNTIDTGTSLPPGPASRDIAAPLAVAGQRGVFVSARGFSQTGVTTVQTLANAPWATVQISLAGGDGLVQFDPGSSSGSGLIAPRAELLLVLGQGGAANGNIDVAGLNVFTGAGGAPGAHVRLTGVVAGAGGTAAAGEAFTHPVAAAGYQINACPIQSINCVLLSPVIVPVGNPVLDLPAPVVHERVDDDDLTLPNVAEQDF